MECESDREWFKLWFNSPYYHILYNERNGVEARQFLSNLQVELRIKPNSRILDIACGEGRFSRLLALEGHRVHGIDIAEENIEKAKRLRQENQCFIRHDMRQPFPFDPGVFDYAFNFFTSFGYFETWEEHEKTLDNVSLVLKKGGEFLIDFMNVEKLSSTIQASETKEIDGITFKLSRSLSDDEVKKKIRVFPQTQPPLEFEEQVKAFTLSDFEKLFSSVSLEIVQVYGDYQLRPFDPKTSDRLIIRSKK